MEYYYIEPLSEYSENGDLSSIRSLLETHPYFEQEKTKEAMVGLF